jgi:hypothetical protein
LAAIGITAVLLALILMLMLLLSAPLTYWLGRATYVGALLHEKLESISQPLTLLQELQKGLNAIGTGAPGTLCTAAPVSDGVDGASPGIDVP